MTAECIDRPQSVFFTLDDAFYQQDFPSLRWLSSLDAIQGRLHLICDIQGFSIEFAFLC
jgi:hypothetical protein